MLKKILLLTLLTIAVLWSFSFAEGPLKICVSQMYPDVIVNGETITGFDIELWEAIAKDMGVTYQYKEVEFNNIFQELEKGKSDVGIGAITMTSPRNEKVYFSHHYMDAGLKILIPKNTEAGFIKTIKSVFTPAVQKCLYYLLLFVFVCGHILWIAEKGKDKINDKYFPGIFEAFWCIVATMSTVGYGDIAPETWKGRFAAFIVMLVGITFFGIIISQLTSTLTTQKFISSISQPEDLRGKVVATKSGTTSEEILNDIGAKVIPFETIDKAYTSLIDGEVGAVLFDSTSIMYFSEHGGKNKVEVLNQLFYKQYYGFAINKERDTLKEKIDMSLLKLRDNGTYDEIYSKWFN